MALIFLEKVLSCRDAASGRYRCIYSAIAHPHVFKYKRKKKTSSSAEKTCEHSLASASMSWKIGQRENGNKWRIQEMANRTSAKTQHFPLQQPSKLLSPMVWWMKIISLATGHTKGNDLKIGSSTWMERQARKGEKKELKPNKWKGRHPGKLA